MQRAASRAIATPINLSDFQNKGKNHVNRKASEVGPDLSIHEKAPHGPSPSKIESPSMKSLTSNHDIT
jgi:hypothetical protein